MIKIFSSFFDVKNVKKLTAKIIQKNDHRRGSFLGHFLTLFGVKKNDPKIDPNSKKGSFF